MPAEEGPLGDAIGDVVKNPTPPTSVVEEPPPEPPPTLEDPQPREVLQDVDQTQLRHPDKPSWSAVPRRLAAPIRNQHASVEDLLIELDRRVKVCEDYTGTRELNWAASLDQMRVEFERQLEACCAGAEASSDSEVRVSLEPTLDSAQAEWIARVKASVDPQLPLARQLRNLSTLVETVYCSSDELRELQNKMDALKFLLEHESTNIPQMFLSTRAKQAYVLENAASIQEAAAMLQQLEELLPYCNKSSQLNVEEHKQRLLRLERRGLHLAQRAAKIYKDLEELSVNYNTAMTLTASFLDSLEA